jgi:PAS domain S-box-containing protein
MADGDRADLAARLEAANLEIARLREANVRLREPHLAEVLDALAEGLQVVDRDWRYRYLNDAAVAHARAPRDALVGRTMMECFPGIERTPMFETLRLCMASREPASMENEFRYPDGTSGVFELRVRPVPAGIAVLSLDVTARRRAEDQLRHSQKMEAIGRLAGGVSHDFRNLLNAVKCFTVFATKTLADDHPARPDLDQVLDAVERGDALTRQLLSVAKRETRAPVTLDLGKVLADNARMLDRFLGSRIHVETLVEPELWRVRMDTSDFEQLVLNLGVNARDAMPDGGKLTLRASNATLHEPVATRKSGAVPAGDYVLFTVEDTGCGMPPEVIERAFEPFFTTKEEGKGTGLGLSICYGIVHGAGGHVWIYSEVGHGTKFRVYLPRDRTGLVAEAAAPPAPAPTPGGTETVLVVDDDPQIHRMVRRILGRLGYRIVEASNATQALELCRTSTVDLLLTDLVLDGASGVELVAAARAIRAGLPCVLMSGYSEDHVRSLGGVDDSIAVIPKPFEIQRLGEVMRKALGQR